MGDTKMLMALGVVLLLWTPQLSSAMKIKASVVCTLKPFPEYQSATYSLTMDMYILDVEPVESKRASYLLPWDQNGAVIAVSPSVCLPLNPATFPSMPTQKHDRTPYHASLYIENTAAFTVGVVSDAGDGSIAALVPGLCDIQVAGIDYTVDVVAALLDDIDSGADTHITFKCTCDPAVNPQQCFDRAYSVAYTPGANPGNVPVAVDNSMTTLLLELVDCITDLPVAATVVMNTCVYIRLTYTFDVTNAQDGVTPMNIYPRSCYAYAMDPRLMTVATDEIPGTQITDDEGCPIEGSIKFAPVHGFLNNKNKGAGAFSPIIWTTGGFPIFKYHGFADIWIICKCKYCVFNTDSDCYGKTTKDRCDKKQKNYGNIASGRKKRSMDRQANQTENLAAKFTVVYPWQQEATNQNGNQLDQTGSDSCLQNASFLTIVVVLLLLMLMAVCVSLVLCYKLRSRQPLHEKHGIDNPEI